MTVYGQRHVLALDRDAQEAITSLQEGVNQEVNNLQEMLRGIGAEMRGKETPDLNALSSVFAELLAQADEAVTTAHARTRQGIAVSEKAISEGGREAGDGIASIAEGAIGQAIQKRGACALLLLI